MLYAFRSRRDQTGLWAWPEWRLQVAPNRNRVPDVIVTMGRPATMILAEAPLLCVEILSPEDRTSRVNNRIEDYLKLGAPSVWLIDAAQEILWIYCLAVFSKAAGPYVKIGGTDIELPLHSIFEA